tara:strand:- start:256 stop:930 length:675 start_codon:yes stop_codon:yes gene_type:complete
MNKEEIEEKMQNIIEEQLELQEKMKSFGDSIFVKISVGALIVVGFVIFLAVPYLEGGPFTFFIGSIFLILLTFVVGAGVVHSMNSKKYQEKITSLNYSLKTWRREKEKIIQKTQLKNEAKNKENDLDYSGALIIWETLGNREEAKRIRKKIREEKKVRVDQTVVHGDYVDDRDTIVKDSVLNRSNIGAGGKSKAEEIKEIKELLDSGAIDDEEYKQMKKDILGK